MGPTDRAHTPSSVQQGCRRWTCRPRPLPRRRRLALVMMVKPVWTLGGLAPFEGGHSASTPYCRITPALATKAGPFPVEVLTGLGRQRADIVTAPAFPWRTRSRASAGQLVPNTPNDVWILCSADPCVGGGGRSMEYWTRVFKAWICLAPLRSLARARWWNARIHRMTITLPPFG